MPRTKKTTETKVVKKSRVAKSDDAPIVENIRSQRPGKKFLILLIILGIALFFYYHKNWLVAAMVDGKPISNLELQMELNKTYREQALDKLVSDKIITQIEREAAAKGIVVSQADIDKQIANDESQYGGKESFDSLLSQQGISREEYIKYDVKIKLLSEKLFENESTPSTEEIQKVIDENIDSPEATEPAKFKEMITKSLRSQKASELINKRYQEIKAKVITL